MEFLEKIDLSDNNLSGPDVDNLLKSLYKKPVKSIAIAKNNIGALGGKAVLSFLRLSDGGKRGDISNIDLNSCHVGEEHVVKIFEELLVHNSKSLRELKIAGNDLKGKRIAKEVLEFMKKSVSLECIDLSWNSLGGDGAKVIFGYLKKPARCVYSRNFTMFIDRSIYSEARKLCGAAILRIVVEIIAQTNSLAPPPTCSQRHQFAKNTFKLERN